MVVAHDDDTGNNSVITFSIVSGNEGGMFAMTTKENKVHILFLWPSNSIIFKSNWSLLKILNYHLHQTINSYT